MRKLLTAGAAVLGAIAFSAAHANVIVNGDLSAGNTGFISDYQYVSGMNSSYPEGTYAIENDPYDSHNLWVNETFPDNLEKSTTSASTWSTFAVTAATLRSTTRR